MKNGFLRVAAACPPVKVADVDYNLRSIEECLSRLEAEKTDIAVFPEMSVTAYTCADLFHSSALLDAAEEAVRKLVALSGTIHVHFAVGVPVRAGNSLYNCAAFIHNGRLDLVAKTYIPSYNEFYESRWWSALSPKQEISLKYAGIDTRITSCDIFESHGALVGIEICEDLWVPVPPSSTMAMKGAEVILNLSASDDLAGKYDYLRGLVGQQSARCHCIYAYSSAAYGESSTDLVFDGKAFVAENGAFLAANRRWTPSDSIAIADADIEIIRHERCHRNTFGDCARNNGLEVNVSHEESIGGTTDLKYRVIDPMPFLPAPGAGFSSRCDEIFNIQAAGLCKRLDAIGCKNIVVGISGGLDSTLALLVAVKAFTRLGLDRKGIIGVTMPGFGTSKRTRGNAGELMRLLGVGMREISIIPAVTQHFKDIGHDISVHDVTYENAQARQRTYLLMDIANQVGGIVLGTGDLSELALGWATYNGDHISMYNVNACVPKTLVRCIVNWYADVCGDKAISSILSDIVATPVSPELLPSDENGDIAQMTENLVGPYELHDFFLYYTLRYGFSPERIRMLARKAFPADKFDDATITHWLDTFMRRFFTQQFKRSCMPDGPKVGSVCLSPRGDWRMPSDASPNLWRLNHGKN